MNWNVFQAQPCALGESPYWAPLEQTLYWLDIPGRQLLRANGYTGDVQRWDLPDEPGCVAPAASGGWVIALRQGLYRARQWQGALEALAPAPYDTASTRFNDGKCDPQGRLWAGSIYEPRDQPLARLYCLDRRPGQAGGLQVQPHADPVAAGATVANGLAWSPDQRTLYWADTTRHLIRAWDWDAASGQLRRPRVFHQFAPKPADWVEGQPGYGGRPDGAAVDAEGHYWAAMYEGGRIVKLSAQGELLAEYPTPVRCPTMPCFGGDDLKTLYVTTARQGRSARELAEHPLSGCVLAMRVPVPGLPVNPFRD